ncbi:hypothetical protein D0466_18870 [Peribacillus glennii]|uniref:Uncharacterized protein n=1 Tax=Peribacillus glennii TaxID=2303991 RepID=A0A372L8N1_9BACI|nr:hypothetical protein D0466_18870 [Peribacillus glennii]
MRFNRFNPGQESFQRRPPVRQFPPFMPRQNPRHTQTPVPKKKTGVTDHIGNIMSHIGKVQTGFNMLREIKSIISFFK